MPEHIKKYLFTLLLIGGFLLPFRGGQAQQNKPNDAQKPAESAEIIKLKKEIKRLGLIKQKLQLENSIVQEKYRKTTLKLKGEVDRLRQINARDKAEFEKTKTKFQRQKEKVNMELTRIRLETSQMNLRKARVEQKLHKLRSAIMKRQQRKQWEDEVNTPLKYKLKPFQKGRLFITDRRVDLNGPIFYGMADYIVDQIEYYNNKSSSKPIFIVINASPGGSVIAGYRILMSMKSSRAPIHVVVKSYAASMAAVILARADHSYAYPNAIILHHQVSSFARGNITQQKERIKLAEDWMRRLATPVAKKMGVSLKEFVKLMYKNNSDGDWREFADRARKLKWIDHVVYEIVELSVTVKPQKPAPPRLQVFIRRSQEQKNFSQEPEAGPTVDKDGGAFFRLPRLTPYDVYFLHNPDNYYRLAP